MCGIAGLVRFAGLKPDERTMGATMAASLRHRGPDDSGHYCDHVASLGHSRLSIIDLEGGHQPLSNEDGTIWVVFNGEIYNHRTLADQLRARGHQWRTECDTEVLVHLYEEFGPSFVDHLNGMFAIAIWDARNRTLVLARDRLGIKPLYWHDDGRCIAFGSELKALLAANVAPRSIDPCSLRDYLTFGHIPAPRTIFRGIRKLEPGFVAICSAQGVRLHRYWDIPFAATDENNSNNSDENTWMDAFAELLQDAVSLRMVADVPVGAFLSGGVDSTIITAAMARQASNRITTQTVGFDEADHDERDAARVVADRFATDHHEVMVRPDAAWSIEQLTRHFDEPFADPAAVPTFYLSDVTRQRVKVALAGDGGDEMLAGYRRYRFDLAEARLRAMAPPWLRRSTAGVAGWIYPKGDWLPRPLRAKVTLENIACDDATAHLRSVAMYAGRLPAMLLRPELAQQASEHDPFMQGRELYSRCPSRDRLNRLLYVDMKTLMVDGILTKVDRASMAVGLEVRVPLLDHRIVELAARMPTSLKYNGTTNKRILRETLSQWAGPTIAHRKKKGFDVPVDAWFRGPLREMSYDLLAARSSVSREWLDRRAVHRIIHDHHRGLRANGPVLWALLCLELWGRTYGTDAESQQHVRQDSTLRNPQRAGSTA